MPKKKKNALEEYQEYYDGMTREEKKNFVLGIFAVSVISRELYYTLSKKKDVK
jgi:hypothetical protein